MNDTAMDKKEYDLIVIGAGSGGLGAALGMHHLGFRVLLIDRKAENMGGECVNTGCIPSKALLHIAKQIHQARLSEEFGLKTAGEVDIQKVKAYITQKQNAIRSHENVEYFREQGLDVLLGNASFASKNEVMVKNKTYKAKNIVIATGSSPRTIAIPGAESFPVFTNDSIFDIDLIPKHFVFIGAGPVSIELGQAFSRLGSRVSIVDRGKRILKKEDPKISEILLKRLQQEGIQFYFDSEVIQIKDGKSAVIKDGTSQQHIPADALFMGIGREINFDSLHLEKAGIDTKEGKIELNQKLQTSNKHVFVSGDAADNLKFSHAAEMHNILLITNFLSPFKKKLNFDHFPWVTFTDPEVATFGQNETQLKKKGIKYERLETDFGEDDRAVTDSYEYGKLVLFIEKKRFYPGNAKILGGSMIAPNAGEITQELILAGVAGIKISTFMNKVYAYPTAANIQKKLLRDKMAKMLKPWMNKIIKKWYRFIE